MTEHRLLNAEREEKILALLRTSGVRSVTAFSSELGVSEATIRRDLHDMQERGLLRRVRGGAVLPGPSRVEPVFADKEEQQAAAKEKISEVALDLIADYDTVYLDGGSTVLKLCRKLERCRGLTIVTNSMMAAETLTGSSHRLIVVGGEFRELSRTLVGPLTEPLIRHLNFDRAFMGTMGFDVPGGMTTTDPDEAFTKELVLNRATQVVLLADNTKLGTVSFARSGTANDIDILITDSVPKTCVEPFRTQGLNIIETGTENTGSVTSRIRN